MPRQSRIRPTILLMLALATSVAAQQPQPPPAKNKKTPAARADADQLSATRRTTAVALVNTLADDARNFRDLVLRARVQARAADSLWETDKDRARVLFRRAWDAAEAADKESGEQRAREASRRGEPESREAGSTRREVLKLTARRDGALGEEFLARLDESRKQEAGEATAAAAAAASNPANHASPRIDPDDPPSLMTQRLNLARELLRDGNIERAMQFGDPALYPINTFGMNLLDMLRQKDAAAADSRFVALAARAATDPSSDANSVSLLSSYVFTPFMYMVFRPNGNTHTRRWSDNNTPPANLPPQVRSAFFSTATNILLRPIPPIEEDMTSTKRGGTYMVIMRLVPLFEQHAPATAPLLRARLSMLLNDAPERVRQSDPTYTRGLVPEENVRDARLQQSLERLERAKDPDERDTYLFEVVMGLMERDPARAREYLSQIQNTDLHRQLRAYMDFETVQKALRDKNVEEAVRAARSGDMTNILRVWAFTEAARLTAKAQPGRAAELLEEAAAEARKIDVNSPERVRAFVAIATQFGEVDRPRAWEMMTDIVKASNAGGEFTGEDGALLLRVQLKRGTMTQSFDVPSFDLTGLFVTLAKDDFNRAVEIVKSLTSEAPRSVATLAVAQTVLGKDRLAASHEESLEATR